MHFTVSPYKLMHKDRTKIYMNEHENGKLGQCRESFKFLWKLNNLYTIGLHLSKFYLLELEELARTVSIQIIKVKIQYQ